MTEEAIAFWGRVIASLTFEQSTTDMQNAQPSTASPLNGSNSLFEAVNAYERLLISEALKLSEGRITKAAEVLRMSHQALAWAIDNRHPELRVVPKKLRKNQGYRT